ncbi:uncharacterized protein PFL1_01588 [Pseudozyma flocculosa PF-1]|uniref:uncharacterized protein n=1 Tax=Pseudozyma flocculosa PF-1 TaxID=1277687 RepID=UPI0004560544|nr:uncharacterized protein PFL1_01588 [Pseudozyma flocculosa PF-1]EPQ30687.1 hypothetical protein PFL1_01588 [Pseudozyma flocculosa PF-1]
MEPGGDEAPALLQLPPNLTEQYVQQDLSLQPFNSRGSDSSTTSYAASSETGGHTDINDLLSLGPSMFAHPPHAMAPHGTQGSNAQVDAGGPQQVGANLSMLYTTAEAARQTYSQMLQSSIAADNAHLERAKEFPFHQHHQHHHHQQHHQHAQQQQYQEQQRRASSSRGSFSTGQHVHMPSESPSSSSTPTSPTSKADRVKAACVKCRRRKIKCTGDMPCGTCLHFKTACVYAAVSPEENAKLREKKMAREEKKKQTAAAALAAAAQARAHAQGLAATQVSHGLPGNLVVGGGGAGMMPVFLQHVPNDDPLAAAAGRPIEARGAVAAAPQQHQQQRRHHAGDGDGANATPPQEPSGANEGPRRAYVDVPGPTILQQSESPATSETGSASSLSSPSVASTSTSWRPRHGGSLSFETTTAAAAGPLPPGKAPSKPQIPCAPVALQAATMQVQPWYSREMQDVMAATLLKHDDGTHDPAANRAKERSQSWDVQSNFSDPWSPASTFTTLVGGPVQSSPLSFVSHDVAASLAAAPLTSYVHTPLLDRIRDGAQQTSWSPSMPSDGSLPGYAGEALEALILPDAMLSTLHDGVQVDTA